MFSTIRSPCCVYVCHQPVILTICMCTVRLYTAPRYFWVKYRPKIDVCSVAYHIYTALSISKEEECDLYGIPSQWSTYPLGGRASMTSQSTYRELAPKHTARKVPVPQGREYQREAARLGSQYRRRCNMQSGSAGLRLLQHHSNVMGVRSRTPTGRGSLCLCLLHSPYLGRIIM